ncbi:alpha/beta-hydrolase [Xylariaceae sp. FL1272]|nr:alpha/beta-hydrolase [Xylariaceae sp. FL1272]
MRQRRQFHLEGIALAPVVFTGLLVSLWTWKCFMMIVFQNKIIYMPGLPPNSRWEKISDYKDRLGGINWREERCKASDGTDLALCVTDLDLGSEKYAQTGGEETDQTKRFYVLYFQGNASSIPPRLPDLSSTLCILKRQMAAEPTQVKLTMICLSYRGYWTSRGRPNEKGLRLDAAAAVEWISHQHQDTHQAPLTHQTDDTNPRPSQSHPPAELILWGQSIGSGIATNLAASFASPSPSPSPPNLNLNSLILETPFTSIRAMLEVLYPQKWLPYKYLWPFLRNQLDSYKNLGLVADRTAEKKTGKTELPEILIVQAAKDELVPAELTEKLYVRCKEVGLDVSRVSVDGAFHNDAIFRSQGRRAVAGFLRERMVE